MMRKVNLNIKNALKTVKRTLTIGLIAIAVAFVGQSFTTHDGHKQGAKKTTKVAYLDLNNGMQKLWNDHMQWTYATVDAFLNNGDALEMTLKRLLQNQVDIGNAVKPFYGEEAGDALAKLLTEHITGAVPVLTAAKESDEQGLEIALKEWYRNAEEIADFLSTANPNWEKEDMREMMKMHITQTTEYSVALLQKDYTKAINLYDEANSHMVHMAVMLTDGIHKQFPKSIKK